ncbi:hypothetical protein [Streptomyces sp. VRA16 Mangrove soil]|uniref:hypothetical protein n=1 Tax=Streptomyces sp. VRA16 Mangrove soil TaxID=2817434 RepID=UPI001A9F5FA2|nr:hypothetical protein [Streptomyces sp. VRA16 Mangrove soil]MBO1333353.1 hypothetical protein [Streptomyces sp. VRA16 Mangrove soil]
MAGRRRAMSRAGSFAVLGALLVGVSGCGADGTRADGRSAAVQRVLDRRADAVLTKDASAYRATGDAEPTLLSDLAEVPLASWAYRLTRVGPTRGERATATAELRYRFRGYDRAPVVTERTLTLRHRSGHWYVTADRPAQKSAEQLWEQGRVTAVKGEHSLVLGVGRERSTLRAYADDADDAVPAVVDAWGADWARRVVVIVPKSLDGMGELLGAPASGYQGIAAVTTGEAGGSRSAPADRVIVNPDAYSVLGAFGKQVVLTHETAHVATRAVTSAATPLWLSEGYADWAGYRGSGRTPAQAAPELQRAVRSGSAPGSLPDDADFGFSGDSGKLARAYESGWMACRMIAGTWGEAKLNAFYKAVGGHRQRAGAVDGALRGVLGIDEQEFLARWRAYVGDELG